MKGPTPRELARAETLRRITVHALDQLAATSAGELSLRAIARDLDIVSSAIYRYYPSRDALLTALIVDAYDDLAAHLEAAGLADRRGPRRRWLDVCTALRTWAAAAPHRFALVYGSAIPGYRAPEDTIAPAGRVVRALLLPLVGHVAPQPVPAPLRPQLEHTATILGLDDDPGALLAMVGAFGRLVGMLTLELNGHFVGAFEPADQLYAAVVAAEADVLGL